MDLSGANLTNANLRGASFAVANLKKIPIKGADGAETGKSLPTTLTGADLTDVDRSNVDLREAVMSEAAGD